MKINANEIRVGMLLEYKDDLWQVLKTQHVKPGKGGAFAQVEMKSVNKNTKLNERFRSSETIEKASVEETILIIYMMMKIIIFLWTQNHLNKLKLKKI
jgi:elongation factor P